MRAKDRREIRRIERYWKKRGRKNFFTWVHRYLRLHSELLEDSDYQALYDYHRNTLIAYERKELNGKDFTDENIGGIIDVLADIYNRNGAERVNKYKPVVELLYKFWKEDASPLNDIRI